MITCFEHEEYFTGCTACQHDCIEENETLKYYNCSMNMRIKELENENRKLYKRINHMGNP